MEKILEHIWLFFLAVGSWCFSRFTNKIDALEKDKADANTTREEILANSKLIHEVDRRIDSVEHMSVNRGEYKGDVKDLHIRINELEKSKASKVQAIRVLKDDDKKEK